MKKHIFYMAMAALSLAVFSSCEDTLTETPDSSYDKDSFFESEANADMAVMGIYSSISDYRHYGWRGRHPMICITPRVPIPTIRYTIWCTTGLLPPTNG